MQLRLPSSISEAQRCLAEGAVPVGGATLVWAGWQRDGFPEQAVSLRNVPEARTVGPEELGGAVLLSKVDATVPEVMHRAASGVGTGAVRRSATVGGNIVGSTLRCLLPAALVLDARATVLEADSVYETDLTELLAKRHVLLALSWRAPWSAATASWRARRAVRRRSSSPPRCTPTATVLVTCGWRYATATRCSARARRTTLTPNRSCTPWRAPTWAPFPPPPGTRSTPRSPTY